MQIQIVRRGKEDILLAGKEISGKEEIKKENLLKWIVPLVKDFNEKERLVIKLKGPDPNNIISAIEPEPLLYHIRSHIKQNPHSIDVGIQLE